MRSVLLLISCSVAFAAQPFTLEQVMSRPFPESLTAAPAGGGLAWVVNAKGARNVWTKNPVPTAADSTQDTGSAEPGTGSEPAPTVTTAAGSSAGSGTGLVPENGTSPPPVETEPTEPPGS